MLIAAGLRAALLGWALCVITVLGDSSSNESDDDATVTLPNGARIRGRHSQTLFAGRRFAAFKGIPYAEPPVGELRFKAPVRKASYPDLLDALEYGGICPQYKVSKSSEDCLTLNIFTPDLSPFESKLPVMVFIHGGSFYEGSSYDGFYGPDFLIEKNVILVTINYRIGILGFLSLGTAEYSGNMGLKDQQLALRWVNDNIAPFGGDPHEITLFGQSAGAASAHFHVLAESSAGLFQRAIMMSGVGDNPWALNDPSDQMVSMMFDLAKTHDNTISTLPDLVKWLTEAPTSILRDGIDLTTSTDYVERVLNIVWAPVIENKDALMPFLHSTDPLQNFTSDVDVMFGYASDEWTYWVAEKLEDPTKLEPLNTDFNIFVPWSHWSKYYETVQYGLMMNEIKEFYFGIDSVIDINSVPTLVRLMSDIIFGYGTNQAVQKYSAASTGKTFYYRFSGDAGWNTFKVLSNTTSLAGASHGDEICYLFKCDIIPGLYDLPADSVERAIQTNVLMLWTNFAKFGHPAPHGNIQPAIPRALHFVDIRNDGLITALSPEKRFYQFWDDMYDKYASAFPE